MLQQLGGIGSSALFTQCVAAIATFAVMLQTGMVSGWTSPNIARLTRENSTIPLTLSEASWVASCLNLGRFVSVILLPLLMEFVGSRKTIACSLLPTAASWSLMLIADSAELLYVARFLGGINFGISYACFSIFLGEVALSDYRGTMISVAMSGNPLGMVVVSVAESYLPMSESSWIYLATSLVTMLLFAWLPDSPFHLVKNKKMEEARRSLVRYRGEEVADKELEAVVDFIEANSKHTFADKMQQLKSPPMPKAILLIVVLSGFVQLTGLFTILFYMEIIMTRAKSFLIDPSEFVIYAYVLAFFALLAAVQIIDKVGRRVLFLCSGIGVTLAMTMLGLHFHLIDHLNFEPAHIQWLPIVSIVLFVVAFNMGVSPVPSCVLGEIFPTSIKSTAACISSLTSALLGFASSKSYQPMVDAMGEAYVFWIYAGISVLTVPVALFWLPETKGKSFQEIQDSL